MEAIIEKIKKLLALAENNTSIHEAANAAALAQQMMLDHKIQTADLEIKDKEEIETHTVLEDGSRIVHWRASLMLTLARNNFCEMVNSKTMRGPDYVRCYKIIGKKSDSDAVQYLFAYLVNEINRLAAEYAVKETEEIVRRGELGTVGKAWFNSFRMGAVTEISNRLYLQRKEAEDKFKSAADLGHAQAGTALVVLNKSKEEIEAYKKKEFPKLVNISGGSISRMNAYSSGREAGRSINLGGGAALGAEPKRIGGRS